MTSSRADLSLTPARAVRFDDRGLTVDLTDGRSLTVPLEWYPRLAHGSEAERLNWTLIAEGRGIHWPLLAGRRSGESPESLARWLAGRARR